MKRSHLLSMIGLIILALASTTACEDTCAAMAFMLREASKAGVIEP